jgi:hypothetical protein
MADKSRLDWELWPHKRTEVRTFRWGVIYECYFDRRLCLLVVERGSFSGTLYEYSDESEFRADRLRVLDFGDSSASAGVPAPSRPNPPTLSNAAFPEPATRR